MRHNQRVESATGGSQLSSKSRQKLGLADRRPVDVKAGSPGKIGVDGHDCSAVALEEGVRVRESTENLAGIDAHLCGVQAHRQAVFSRAADVGGMGEQVGSRP